MFMVTFVPVDYSGSMLMRDEAWRQVAYQGPSQRTIPVRHIVWTQHQFARRSRYLYLPMARQYSRLLAQSAAMHMTTLSGPQWRSCLPPSYYCSVPFV